MTLSAKERVALHRYRKRNGIPVPPRVCKPLKPRAPKKESKYQAARKTKSGRMLPEIQIALYAENEHDRDWMSDLPAAALEFGYPNVSALARALLQQWWVSQCP